MPVTPKRYVLCTMPEMTLNSVLSDRAVVTISTLPVYDSFSLMMCRPGSPVMGTRNPRF